MMRCMFLRIARHDCLGSPHLCRRYMEATQLEQISYNLQQSKLQIRQMDESVQQVRGMQL